MLIRLGALLLAILIPALPAAADSSAPLLAAYYDRQMAIVGEVAYGWRGTDRPKRIFDGAVQVGVGRSNYYVLTTAGALLKFADASPKSRQVADGVARFAAGRTGVLAILKTGALWWFAVDGDKRKIADSVATAAVGVGANYYVSETGALFVKGLAHRGQYGDGRLTTTDGFVQTAADVAAITAHTGHAIMMTKSGDVLGTGGNINGPVGRHGFGDKAVRWSKILSGATAIATGSSHSLAILPGGILMAWGGITARTPSPL